MKIESKFIQRCLLLCTLALLSACTSKPLKTEKPVGWQARQAALAGIDDWHLSARIGLRSKNRSGSATLIWDEKPDQRNLRLLGPLGGGLILLQQDETGVSLQDGQGKTWQSYDAGELIYRVTGWQIPVSGLRWWLLGMTEPGSRAEFSMDDSQRLTRVQQDGWIVSLDKYTLFGEHELPASIVMETDTSLDDERYIRAKLIVKEWEFEMKEER